METKMDAIYFDHAATTPLDERVLDAMLPWLKQEIGNANSMHQMGQRAKVALEEARDSIASLLHFEPSEVIFTSGGNLYQWRYREQYRLHSWRLRSRR